MATSPAIVFTFFALLARLGSPSPESDLDNLDLDLDMRSCLVEQGALAKDSADKKRAKLLALVRDMYARHFSYIDELPY
jgi:hypothetical protein